MMPAADGTAAGASSLARLTLWALRRSGIAEVILSPGSRSAPLAYPLAEGAEPGLRLHVRHDERVAAFVALGVGKAALHAPATSDRTSGPTPMPSAAGAPSGGLPGWLSGWAAVVTTSGTAAANLHPAVLEAHHANVPLAVVTADRPPRLRGTWANQTSELQPRLFAGALRAQLDLDDATAAADPARALRALLSALAAAVGADGGRPGPVQLNLGFDDPLVPDRIDPGWVPPADPDRIAPGGPPSYPAQPVRGNEGLVPDSPMLDGPVLDGPVLDGPVLELPNGPRTVVVAGDGAGPAARGLAEQAGWPLLAEPSSGARSGPNAIGPYAPLLRSGLGESVQRAVVFGRPTLSRPVTRLLASGAVELVLVSPFPDWPEPGRAVTRAARVRAAGPPTAPDARWLQRWQSAGAAAARAIDDLLDAEAAAGRLTGPLVAREVAAALQPGEVLVSAASSPIRDLDLAGAPFDEPLADPAARLVLANRGLAGIDGTTSTATGVALAQRPIGAGPARAGSARAGSAGAGSAGAGPTRLLIGDVAFLHDLNALLAAPGEDRPWLQVIVLNDCGGAIFGALEHGARAERGLAERAVFERVFGTPHASDLAALCAGVGVPHRRVGSLGELRTALAQPALGTSVVEVPARRDTRRQLDAGIAACCAHALHQGHSQAV